MYNYSKAIIEFSIQCYNIDKTFIWVQFSQVKSFVYHSTFAYDILYSHYVKYVCYTYIYI